MSKDDEYRQYAAEAQQWADSAKTDDDRAAWLRIAQGWLGLLRKRPRTPQEAFDEEVAMRGTHPEPDTRN